METPNGVQEFNWFLHPDPLRTENGRPALHLDCGATRIVLDGSASISLFAGWQARFAYSGFAPILILQLYHPKDGFAVWYVSSAGDRLGDRPAGLSERNRDLLRASATPILRRLVERISAQPDPELDDAARGFLALDERCRLDLLELCKDITETSGQFFPIREVPDRFLINPGDGAGAMVLRKSLLQAILEHNLQDCVPEMIARRGLVVPCPNTGEDIISQGSVCFDDFHFAYRFTDSSRRIVFYIIAGHELCHSYALYFPCIATSFALPFREGLGPDARKIFQALMPAHVVRHGALLEAYFNTPLLGISSPLRAPPWTHIGHQLWNELTGIDRLLGTIEPDAPIAEFIVPDGEREIEFYGPIETLFPRLKGHVVRGLRNVGDVTRHAYSNRRLVVRITRDHVSTELRRRVLDCARRAVPEPEGLAGLDQPGLVLLLGLRIENRTLVDLGGFYDTLISRIRASHVATRFVIDGHNVAAVSGTKYSSHGETADDNTRVQMAEHALVARLQAHHGADVVINAVGLPVQENLVLIDRCDGFVAPWGAGLAKYRWVCNKPGFVLSNRWNLSNRTDLRIYDSASTLEDPAPMRWIAENRITDEPDAERILGHLDHPQWSNFSIDEPRVITDILGWIATLPVQPPERVEGKGFVLDVCGPSEDGEQASRP